MIVENRQTFLDRLRPISSPSQLLNIDLAYTLSKYVHRAQVRMEIGPDGEPLRYFEHPRRVALILMDVAGIYDPEMICAALLHDAVEDSEELSPEQIEKRFGEEVASIVQTLSKIPKDGYTLRLAGSGWKTVLIKACDRLDNLRSLKSDEVPKEFILKQLNETADIYLPIFSRIPWSVPVQNYNGADRVVREISDLCYGLSGQE